jgi:hypothetical protein
MTWDTRSIRTLIASWALLVGFSVLAEAQCEYKNVQHYRQQSMKRSKGHRTGNHQAKLNLKFRCQCESSCRSNCSVDYNEDPICQDTGRIKGLRVHRVYSNEKVAQGTKANATSGGGANCGAALGCFVEECLPGLCTGLSISVKGEPLGVGAGVTFTARPMPYWSASIEIPFECEECWRSRAVTDELESMGQEYIPADEGGYGTGSGSVYRMCYWECDSWTDAQGIFQEYCEVKECMTF